MEQKDNNEYQATDEPKNPVFDDIENLYIGSIEKATGSISIDMQEEPLPLIIWGEVLFYGHAEGEIFVVERLRRVALYGALENPDSAPRIGVFSLAGPLKERVLEPGSGGIIEGLVEQLHYRALSSELEPLSTTDDAVFPQVEQIESRLAWNQQEKLDETRVQINISFTADQLVEDEKKLGIVRRITLDPIIITFVLAGTGGPGPEPRRSLQSNCPAPPAEPCTDYPTVTRFVSLRFINFSTLPTADVEALCNAQIEGLCEVWRNKAALQFIVESKLIPASNDTPSYHRDSYRFLNPAEEHLDPKEAIGTTIDTLGYDSTTGIEVYLIDQFNTPNRHFGGISYDCGQGSAYCILDLGLAPLYPYVLAHEIGHILGLTDSNNTAGAFPGSPGSIMEPPTDPPLNTLYNCRIFASPTLNPPFSTSTTADCFRPDF